MTISKEYKEYIEECLYRVGDVRILAMMGGYLVYYKNKLMQSIFEMLFCCNQK